MPKVLKQSVKVVHRVCTNLDYNKYRVVVVVEPHEESPVLQAEVLTVPKDYSVDAKYKARALQYALQHIENNKNTWILHLDEESFLTEQCLRAVLEHIEDGGAPIAEGAINYPNDLSNLFTFFMESDRATSCHYCVDQMKGHPVWLHGSNLLVRSDVEHLIGWQFGDCLAEDQRFAYEAHRRGVKFGWHGGTILEQPAKTLRDAIRQRMRWFTGSLQNFRYLDNGQKVLQSYMLGSWVLGFFAGIIGVLSWFGVTSPEPNLWMFVFLTHMIWLLQYQIGLKINLNHLNLGWFERLKLHVLQLVLSPIIGLLSTAPAFIALLKRPKRFEVIKK